MPPTTPEAHRQEDQSERSALVRVAPRHLAGPDPTTALADTLIREHHWTQRAAGTDEQHLTSPCGRLQLHVTADLDDAWVLAGAQHRGGALNWRCSFAIATPPEFVAAAVEEASAILAESDPPKRAPFQPGNPMTALFPLARAGWHEYVLPSGGASFKSPDEWLRVVSTSPRTLHDLRGLPAFRISCFHANRSWTARASAATPARVLAAVTRALADPAPLLRDRHWLNLPRNALAQLTIEPAFPDDTHRALGRRPAATTRSSVFAAPPTPASTARDLAPATQQQARDLPRRR